MHEDYFFQGFELTPELPNAFLVVQNNNLDVSEHTAWFIILGLEQVPQFLKIGFGSADYVSTFDYFDSVCLEVLFAEFLLGLDAGSIEAHLVSEVFLYHVVLVERD